jgi:hypothetical protein
VNHAPTVLDSTRPPATGRRAVAPSTARPSSWGSVLVAAVVALAVAGGALAALLVLDAGGGASASTLTTPTGTLEVGPLALGAPQDPKDMIGMPADAHETHVGVQAQVAVSMTNTSDQPVQYSEQQFRLLTVDGDVAPETGPPTAGIQVLRPGAAITMRLSFRAPSLEQPRLRYTPTVGSPVTAALAVVAAGGVPAGSAGSRPEPGGAAPDGAPQEEAGPHDHPSHEQSPHETSPSDRSSSADDSSPAKDH